MADHKFYVLARLKKPHHARAEWGPFDRDQAGQVKGIMTQSESFAEIEIVPEDYDPPPGIVRRPTI